MRAFYEDMAQLERRKITCQPIPARWDTFAERPLSWQRVSFAQAEARRVPQGPGFFCFFIGPPPGTLPPIGYPLYFGSTHETLRRKFAEYIQEQQGISRRPQTRDFLEIFEGELVFMCTTFDGSPEEALIAAREIRAALQPAFGDSDYDAVVGPSQGAW